MSVVASKVVVGADRSCLLVSSFTKAILVKLAYVFSQGKDNVFAKLLDGWASSPSYASVFTYHLQPDVVADSYTLPWKPGWCANFQPREEGYTKRMTTLLSSCMLSSYLKSKWCFSMWTAVVVFTIRRNTPFLAFQPVFGLYWLMKMLD